MKTFNKYKIRYRKHESRKEWEEKDINNSNVYYTVFKNSWK